MSVQDWDAKRIARHILRMDLYQPYIAGCLNSSRSSCCGGFSARSPGPRSAGLAALRGEKRDRVCSITHLQDGSVPQSSVTNATMSVCRIALALSKTSPWSTYQV